MSVELWQIFRELCCIKLRGDKRKFVLQSKTVFESTGSVPKHVRRKLYKMCSDYSIQIEQLNDARDKARHTNGRLADGLRQDEVEQRRLERELNESARRSDFGF